MKTRSYFSTLVASTTLFFSTVSNAQLTAGNLRSAENERTAVFNADVNADAAALASLKAMNGKIHKHFTRNFNDAKNIYIRTVKDELRVTFTLDGISSCSQYNARGRWLFAISYYPESNLDDDTRNQVESGYPGFLVGGTVAEIKVPGNSAKLVMIENKKEWKRILVTSEDMKVYEAYRKQ